VAEGANMPTTLEAVDIFIEAGILFAPGKASNAGGVAVSGLEMSQNAMRLLWTAGEVDSKLHNIMQSIHHACVHYGEENGRSTTSKARTSPASSKSPMRCWPKAWFKPVRCGSLRSLIASGALPQHLVTQPGAEQCPAQRRAPVDQALTASA
jgi:hypothetical protein